MAEITAAMVKSLREDTGQGMMECKKALEETNGDIEAAKDLLRKKAGAKAEKKADRETSEGLVALHVSDDKKTATMVEVRCETDFCARNDVFVEMVDQVLEYAKSAQAGEVTDDEAIKTAVQEAFTKIGENMSYGRGVKISAEKVGGYRHHNNKVGVIVGVDQDVDDEILTGVCMHIAFSDPMGITVDDIPADVAEKERKFAVEQAVESGKPQEIAEKMVEGKMRKFLSQNALMEQAYVRDESKTIKEVLGGATVTAFARFAL
ncbi:MAG: translation elongation factor Ts [Phycisphaerae bacterium]